MALIHSWVSLRLFINTTDKFIMIWWCDKVVWSWEKGKIQKELTVKIKIRNCTWILHASLHNPMTFQMQIVHRHKVPLSITNLYLKNKAHWRSEFNVVHKSIFVNIIVLAKLTLHALSAQLQFRLNLQNLNSLINVPTRYDILTTYLWLYATLKTSVGRKWNFGGLLSRVRYFNFELLMFENSRSQACGCNWAMI